MNPFEPEQEGLAPQDYGTQVNSHTESISDIEWSLNRLKDRYASLLLTVDGLQQIQDNSPEISQAVTQVNDFVRGQAIYYNPDTAKYEKSKADTEATAECCGIVTSAAADIFTVATSGAIDLSDLGLINGYIYYVSPTTAGGLTLTKPLTEGHVQKPILLALKDGMAEVVNMRGLVVEQMIDQHVDTDSDVEHASLILTDLTASTALVSSATKEITSSATTATELGYVHDVTSPIQTQLNALTTYNTLLGTITSEPTGFSGAPVVTYDAATQKVTLSGTYAAYLKGVVVAALTGTVESTAHTNTTGHTYFLSHNGTSFVWATDGLPGYDTILIAIVSYGATHKFGLRECHGFMPHTVHNVLHNTIGTYKVSGGAVAGITLGSVTAAERRPSISECIIMDEDCSTTNVVQADNATTNAHFFNSGTAAEFAVDQTEIVPLTGAQPAYNSFSTPNWGQTGMPANSLATVWLMELPVAAGATNQKYRHVWIQPQWVTQAQNSSSGSLLTAQSAEEARLPSELNLTTLSALIPEFVLIARLTIQYTGGDWSIVKNQVLTGSRYSQVATLATGNYLASVTTDTTMTGAGTVASPLTVTQSYVLNTGNETVAGIKTFSSFPVTPSEAPTTDYQVANKKYVDDNGVDDSGFVHTTGDESIAGNKTFTGTVFFETATESIIGESWI